MRTLRICLTLVPFQLGCNSECEDPGRIDGDYAVFSNTASDDWTITGFSVEQEEEQTALLNSVFANGRSEWDLKYIPGNTSFQLSLNDQPFTALYTQDTESCNSFLLKFSGTYTTDIDSIHQFSWEGELSYFGAKLGGTFSYRDDWTQTIQEDDGNGGTQNVPLNGTLTIIDGEFNASSKQDTGS